jgi:hypothetical protein
LERNNPLISIREWEALAIERYSECPRQMTIVRHADNQDDSEFFCILAASFEGPVLPGVHAEYRRYFDVPGQDMTVVEDSQFGPFSVVQVWDQHDRSAYFLFTGVHSRMGFLVLADDVAVLLDREEEFA